MAHITGSVMICDCTTVVQKVWDETKPNRARPVRQSVTIPAPLAAEVRCVARQRSLTMSRAIFGKDAIAGDTLL